MKVQHYATVMVGLFVRFAGNEVAHDDLAEEAIRADDARDVLDLMDAILLRVYQEPAQVEQV
jgi:hypothetical protein